MQRLICKSLLIAILVLPLLAQAQLNPANYFDAPNLS